MYSSQDSPNASPTHTEMHNIDYMHYRPLCNACLEGDWSSVERFFEANPDPNLWSTPIDRLGRTALSIAAISNQIELIEKFMNVMSEEALLAQDLQGFTALHNIARNGNTKAAMILVRRNPRLTQIRDNQGETPILTAALFARKELLQYLLSVTVPIGELYSPFTGTDGATLLVSMINIDLYDVALKLIQHYPEIATTRDIRGRSAISALATKSWPSTTSRDEEQLGHNLRTNSMLVKGDGVFATALKRLGFNRWDRPRSFKAGGVDFIKLIIKTDYNQIWSCDKNGNSMFHNAIIYRQKEVFRYVKHLGFKDELSSEKDKSGNTILHLAATLPPPGVLNQISGAALQVQHELKWYKEVAALVPFHNDIRNYRGLTPKDMFFEEHRDLMRQGEIWMQNIAGSAMIVSTLIATVVFAAAFTVPGGNRNDIGVPIFLNKATYMIFAVSNALALFFSFTSTLIFTSTLTSNYGVEDFLVSLPRRVIIGQAMLFFAVATMTMAFSATYFIMLGHDLLWVSTVIAILVCLPVLVFAVLQFRLFVEIIKSTYISFL